jgi:hypothetical protein
MVDFLKDLFLVRYTCLSQGAMSHLGASQHQAGAAHVNFSFCTVFIDICTAIPIPERWHKSCKSHSKLLFIDFLMKD